VSGLGTPGRTMSTSSSRYAGGGGGGGGGHPTPGESDGGSRTRASSMVSGISTNMENVFQWGIDREGLAGYGMLEEGSKSSVVTDARSPTRTEDK